MTFKMQTATIEAESSDFWACFLILSIGIEVTYEPD